MRLDLSDTFSLACLALMFCVTPPAADPAVEHQWVGESQMSDAKHFVELSLEGENKALTGVISYPASGLKDMPVLRQNSSLLRNQQAYTKACNIVTRTRSGRTKFLRTTAAFEKGQLRLLVQPAVIV